MFLKLCYVTLNKASDWCGYSLDGASNVTMNKDNITSFSKEITGLSEAHHSVKFHCNDTSGNMNNTAIPRNFSIDTTPPTISIAEPTNTTYTTDNITITFNSDGFDRSWYILNGGSSVFFSNGSSFLSSQGSNTLEVFVNDTSGNVNHTSVLFTTDSVGPLIDVVSPLNITYNISAIDFNVSLNEEVDVCTVSYNGAPNVTMTELNYTYWTYIQNISYVGSHNVIFSCNDTAGNINSTAAVFFSATSPFGMNITVLIEETEEVIKYFNVTVFGTDNTYNFTGDNVSYLFIQASDLPNQTGIKIRVENVAYEYRDYFLDTGNGITTKLTAYLSNNPRLMRFLTRENAGATISNVDIDVELLIEGVFTLVAEATTDGTGLTSIYLNDRTEYRMTFEKSGYDTIVVFVAPIFGQTYEVIMNKTIAVNYNGTWEGITYTIEPYENSLVANDTVNFILTVTNINNDFDWFAMNVTLNNTIGLYFENSTSANGGTMNFSTHLTNYIGNISVTFLFERVGGVIDNAYKLYIVSEVLKSGYTLKDTLEFIRENTGISNIEGAFIILILMAFGMTVASGIFGKVGASIVGVIILGFIVYINILPFDFFVLITLTVGIILYLKWRM